MNPLEFELRETFRASANEVPAAATARLVATDYRPRNRRLQPRLAVGGGVLTAGAATAVILSLTGGASTAFAGWSASPTKATMAQLGSADRTCRANVPLKGLPLALTDTRGPYTFEIYASKTQFSDCMVGPSFLNTNGTTSDGPYAPPAGQIILNPSHTTTADGQTFSMANGAVGPGVTGVTLNLDDGSQVTATVQNGWFVGWWPGSTALVSADVHTSSGTHTQVVHYKICNGCGGTPTTDGPGTPAPSGPHGG